MTAKIRRAVQVLFLLLFIGLYVRKVVSGPLIPLKDPRLPEALHHKNYV